MLKDFNIYGIKGKNSTTWSRWQRRVSSTFTNGTVEQLREIRKFLETEGFDLSGETDEDKLADVVRVGISWLERIKEQSKKNKSE